MSRSHKIALCIAVALLPALLCALFNTYVMPTRLIWPGVLAALCLSPQIGTSAWIALSARRRR